MKKFFVALTIFFCMTGGNFVNAAPFTESQFDKIFTDVTKNPAAAPENSATLDLNIDTLKEKFNGFVAPFLKNSLGVDDVSAFEHLYMIKTYKIFPNDGGEYWYKGRVEMITIDGDKETRKAVSVLVQASTLDDAVHALKQFLGTYDCEIISVAKSPIMDVIRAVN